MSATRAGATANIKGVSSRVRAKRGALCQLAELR
jgi:hypothetical protein